MNQLKAFSLAVFPVELVSSQPVRAAIQHFLLLWSTVSKNKI